MDSIISKIFFLTVVAILSSCGGPATLDWNTPVEPDISETEDKFAGVFYAKIKSSETTEFGLSADDLSETLQVLEELGMNHYEKKGQVSSWLIV